MTHTEAIETLAAERYQLQEMSDVERDAFEAHYFDCLECAEDVRLGELVRLEARRAGALPLSAAAPPLAAAANYPVWRRPLITVPWAIAASLAVVAGYQSLVTVPALRDALAPQPLAPVMLRGATRGELPTVVLQAGQPFITLGVDITAEPDAQEVDYTLLDSNRATILSGRAPLPPSGTPLMLLMPAREFDGPGRYTLVVHAGEGTTVPLGEYGFAIAD